MKIRDLRVEDRAPRDGHRPATEETWSCPNCGKPATAFVSLYRVVACGQCRWLFKVDLLRSYNDIGGDVYEAARLMAEQRPGEE